MENPNHIIIKKEEPWGGECRENVRSYVSSSVGQRTDATSYINHKPIELKSKQTLNCLGFLELTSGLFSFSPNSFLLRLDNIDNPAK